MQVEIFGIQLAILVVVADWAIRLRQKLHPNITRKLDRIGLYQRELNWIKFFDVIANGGENLHSCITTSLDMDSLEVVIDAFLQGNHANVTVLTTILVGDNGLIPIKIEQLNVARLLKILTDNPKTTSIVRRNVERNRDVLVQNRIPIVYLERSEYPTNKIIAIAG